MENGKKSKLDIAAEYLYKAVQWFCVLCLAGQVVVVSYTVFGRFVLNNTPSWSEEISKTMLVWMSLMSATLAIYDDTHVRMTVTDGLFGKLGMKIRSAIFYIIDIIFCGMLFWKGLNLIQQTSGTKMPGSGLPSSVLYASICISGLMMALMLLYRLGGLLCQEK